MGWYYLHDCTNKCNKMIVAIAEWQNVGKQGRIKQFCIIMYCHPINPCHSLVTNAIMNIPPLSERRKRLKDVSFVQDCPWIY